ncbi:class I SAM-dependent methyltransferase [Streptomyces oryzae]|uniref:Class I SAM-dependent methyltransferase n=1 Tax=Streptomyces oryzae TaxID=1434886 RepID=A0ABS3X706_9ACTN|nr:class I SAM-dependent methyltransferase [Streptomyces oryzae]MBO8191109.1 class I SAM-dependent methyltransferase [Streptomyces oryzae]
MATQIAATEELLAYVEAVSPAEDEVLGALRTLTAELPGGTAMQVPAAEARFLSLLIQLTGASTVVEIGTFTGYSTLCMARALPEGGHVITCDVNKKWTDIAAEYWERAQVADRIDLRLGDARETLAGLREERGAGSVDLVFIDADKKGYPAYYEASLELVRPGGLLVLDNTLFFGRVVDPAADDPDTVAIRQVNELVRSDERVEACLLPVADGMTLARKKAG